MSILPKGKSVHFDDRYLRVELEDERVILTPISWYKELQEASLKQLSNYQFICQGSGIEWPELDYHLSIESMLLADIKNMPPKNGTFTMNEIIFLVEDAPEGGFSARALEASIFTDADDINDLHQKVREAVDCHFEPADKPKMIRLHFVREQVIAA